MTPTFPSRTSRTNLGKRNPSLPTQRLQMLQKPTTPYYLHDVPVDMDTLIYQWITECSESPETSAFYEYWDESFCEDSAVDHELTLVRLDLDLIQGLPRHDDLHLYEDALGDLPPLIVARGYLVDGRHRADLYRREGYDAAIAIDLTASGLPVEVNRFHALPIY